MCNLVIIIRYSSICVIGIAIYAYWKITRLNFCKYLGEIVPFLLKSIIKSIIKSKPHRYENQNELCARVNWVHNFGGWVIITIYYDKYNVLAIINQFSRNRMLNYFIEFHCGRVI